MSILTLPAVGRRHLEDALIAKARRGGGRLGEVYMQRKSTSEANPASEGEMFASQLRRCLKHAHDILLPPELSRVGILEELQSEVDCWMDGWPGRARERGKDC